MSETEQPPHAGDHLRKSVHLRSERRRRSQREGEPTFAHYLAQVGVLGWTIVIPGLLGLFLGRWLDHRFGTGIFWSAPLLLLGLALGCWSAWRWMHSA